RCYAEGLSVGHAHIRWLNPFPRNLADVIGRFKKVLIPELNMGQLRMLIQAKYGVECEGLNKVKGRPFAIGELQEKIRELCG
ncbi:MAG TPA: 2-oxoglutarate ferredoxin oxidoreductase subunit alpha, partial [Planctomycetaceae bacterium]|nr:2-oxoglutarate ferredoxin oxidoreductase subunit alpha [Planctomycetaceae bacterium]